MVKELADEGALYSERSLKYLIGNKIDLDRKVATDSGQEKGDSMNIPFFEVSAKTGENTEKLLSQIVEDLFR